MSFISIETAALFFTSSVLVLEDVSTYLGFLRVVVDLLE